MDPNAPGGQASFDLPHLIGLLDFFHQTVTLSPMVITVARYDDGSCRYVSPTFKEMTGYDPQLLKEGGLNWLVAHLHPEDRAPFKLNFTESFIFLLGLPSDKKLKCFFNLTTRFVHRNGTPLWIYYQCRPLAVDKDGKPHYSLNLIADLTHLKAGSDPVPCWSVVEHNDDSRPLYLGGSCNDSFRWLFGQVNSPLSKRETEVLKAFMKGSTGKQVAVSLKLSLNTVETHRKGILRKCHATKINQAIEMALKNDWINE